MGFIVTDTDMVPLVQPAADVVTARYVPVLTLREVTVVLLSVHLIPLPPKPGVAVMLLVPPHCEPPPLIAGASGMGCTVTLSTLLTGMSHRPPVPSTVRTV
jgi:hypothetical protein